MSAAPTQTSISIALEAIDPDEARAMLNVGGHNRNVRLGRVEQYARDMDAGNWHPVGEPIQIGLDNTVLNGQHRLLAVIEADMTVSFLVMRNVPIEYQAVADRGLQRTFGDVLKLHYGESDGENLAAAVRQVHTYRTTLKLGNAGGNASISELIATYKAEPNLVHSLPYGRALAKSEIETPKALATALHYLFAEKDPNQAGPYFRSVTTGEMLASNDPIFCLRRVLMPTSNNRRAESRLDRHVAALHIKTFNWWRLGIAVKRVSWVESGTKKEAFPRILTADEIDE